MWRTEQISVWFRWHHAPWKWSVSVLFWYWTILLLTKPIQSTRSLITCIKFDHFASATHFFSTFDCTCETWSILFIHIRLGIYDTKTVMTYIFRAVPLGASELLLRGSKLKNTSWIFGVVVYTGEESKLRLNSVKTPLKRSHIEKLTNIQVHHLYCTCMWIRLLFCPPKLIKKLLSKFVLVAIPNRSDCSTFFNNAMNGIL